MLFSMLLSNELSALLETKLNMERPLFHVGKMQQVAPGAKFSSKVRCHINQFLFEWTE